MTFANPLGWLALVTGVLAVVVVHFFRVKARTVPTSTLFLVEAKAETSDAGRRLDRVRTSPLFWLQILAVLLVGWLLLDPRWLRDDATQRVVLVVDVSASMSAFETAFERALSEALPALEETASRTEWIVLASDAREKTLYVGTDRDAARSAASSVAPRLGAHDMIPVLVSAVTLGGRAGRVVLVTDHRVEVPEGVELLAVGRPTDNVGFAGVDVSPDGRWSAIVKNFGASSQTRRLGADTLTLDPGELAFVEGTLSPEQESITLELERDAFTLDDRLALIRPRAKSLAVYVEPSLEESRFVASFLETIAPIERATSATSSDLVIGTSAVGSGSAGIVFAPSPSRPPPFRDRLVVAERHPFVEGLDFRGLLVRDVPPLAHGEEDTVLLWQGSEPLMVLRRQSDRTELAVSLALEASNADRVPAFVLALHRFVDTLRESQVALEQKNVETGQLLSVASREGEALTMGGAELGSESAFRAPLEPGPFEVTAGGRPLLRAAARFADVREAELSEATRVTLSSDSKRESLERNTLPDPLAQLWVLVLMAVVVAGYGSRGA